MQIPLFIQRRWNAKKPPLNLFWWRYNFPSQLNFGDEITSVIIKKLWGYRCRWSDINDCELVGVGSIIEKIIREKKNNNTVKVWGSGFMNEGGEAYNCESLDFLAVRGLLSLSRIKKNHKAVVGDPGLLANLVFDRSKHRTHKIGIVAHYVDADHPILDKVKHDDNYLVINPLQTPEKVISDITSCRLIFSSSLHGLIVADSFGIPNYWMPLSDNVSGHGYKFRDYYTSIGRSPIKKNASIIKNKHEIDKAINDYVKIKNIKQIQKSLIRSFPYNKNLPVKRILILLLKPAVLINRFKRV